MKKSRPQRQRKLPDLPDDTTTLIEKDVTKAEFRQIAREHGHDEKVTEFFLRSDAPIRHRVRIGGFNLLVTDW